MSNFSVMIPSFVQFINTRDCLVSSLVVSSFIFHSKSVFMRSVMKAIVTVANLKCRMLCFFFLQIFCGLLLFSFSHGLFQVFMQQNSNQMFNVSFSLCHFVSTVNGFENIFNRQLTKIKNCYTNNIVNSFKNFLSLTQTHTHTHAFDSFGKDIKNCSFELFGCGLTFHLSYDRIVKHENITVHFSFYRL